MIPDQPPHAPGESESLKIGRPADQSDDRQPPAVLRQYLSADNPQFSILELMLITGICAVTITLITSVGIYGVFGLFLCCFGMWVYLRQSMTNPTKLRFWNQFMWGVLMPIGCIFGDPFVFGSFDRGAARSLEPYAFACYAFMGWEIVCLLVSCFIGPAQKRLNQLLAGSLLAGAIFALVIAIGMIPITLLALMVLIGFIGFTPWFTANVYFRTALMHWRRAKTAADGGFGYLFVLAGFLSAIFIGAIVFVLTSPDFVGFSATQVVSCLHPATAFD